MSDVNTPVTYTFDSGSTVVNDDLGNPWLSIGPNTVPNIDAVIIQDFNSLTTITILLYPQQLYNLHVSEYGCFCLLIVY